MTTMMLKGLEIGKGSPKIIIPIVGKTEQELVEEIKILKDIDFDIVEWRVDYFHAVNDIDAVTSMLNKINEMIGQKPILFTFRTHNEGGNYPASLEFYLNLSRQVIINKQIDLIDIEVFIGDIYAKEIINFAQENNILVIASNHDFNRTPDKNDIISRLVKMQNLGANIAKIAVMPRSPEDVLTLLSATTEMKKNYSTIPLITMSMSGIGAISRISGEVFGSDLTFAAAKNISAPGQLNAKSLRSTLKTLHDSCL